MLVHRRQKQREQQGEDGADEELVPCSFCSEQVKKSEISRHEMSHIRAGTLYDCNFCGKKLPYKTWIRHVAAHKKILAVGRPPKVTCHICQNSYADITQHIARMHQERQRYPCKQCGKTFAEPRFLQRHETIHTKVCQI